jgi:D-alanyl-D-alanine carboxypeptidase
MSRRVTLLLCLLFMNAVAQAQTVAADEADKFVRAWQAEKKIPGLAVAVVKDGKVVKEGVYGVANVELNVPVNTETVFEIASMSKQFTCAAILLLQQDHKLSVNDKLSKHLGNLPASWSTITLNQLMNHTTGMRDDWVEGTPYFMVNYNDSLMFEAQKKSPLLFKPGQAFNYSSGPFTLGLVVAKVSGKPFASFLKERIFQPLGMTHSSLYDHSQIVLHRASGYVIKNDTLWNGADIASAAEARGDVGVITSIGDMIKWVSALEDDRLLNAASRQAMFTPERLPNGKYIDYGFGWTVVPSLGHLMQQHGGSFRTGFHSDIRRYPDLKISVIVLTNLWSSNSYDIASKLASLYSPELKLMSERTPSKDPNTKRTASLANFIAQGAKGTLSKAQRQNLGPVIELDSAYLTRFFKGHKQLTFIDHIEMTTHPIDFAGDKITTTCLYKVEGEKTRYISTGYNAAGKWVSMCWEE